MTRTRNTPKNLAAQPVAAFLLAALFLWTPGTAAAMQILEAADHAELEAVISDRAVSRVALAGDRIARVIRGPDGFAVEHDKARGDVYLRPTGRSGVPREPVTLFIGTVKGFTYLLTLRAAAQGSAQILIRNAAAAPREDSPRPGYARVGALVALVRAVARREVPRGYAIETFSGTPGSRGSCTARGLARAALYRARVRGGREVWGTTSTLSCKVSRRAPPRSGSLRLRAVPRADGSRWYGARSLPDWVGAMSGQNKTPMDPESRRVRGRQLLLFSGIAAALLIAFAVWFSGGDGGAPPPRSGVRAELAGSRSAEAVWLRRSEARIGGLETRLREMETKSRRSGEENARLKQRLTRDAEDGRLVIDRQAAVIEEMRRRLETRPAAQAPGSRTPGAPGVSGVKGKRTTPGGKAPAPMAPMIQEFEKVPNPADEDPAPGPRPIGSWLPAGAYAEAVVLAGVDASVGVSSQGDPRPVLLQPDGQGAERGRGRRGAPSRRCGLHADRRGLRGSFFRENLRAACRP